MNKYLNPKAYFNYIRHRLFFARKSYAQCGEDLVLDCFLTDIKNGFYADVGANHPKRLNNTYFFYKKGWRGINIEPDPKSFGRFLGARRGDINLNIGIGDRSGSADFYIFKSDTLSTFSKESAEKSEKMGYPLEGVKKIEMMPLSAVFGKHLPPGKEIDLLSVDTEGFDEIVLKGNDWARFRPKFIVAETLEFGETSKEESGRETIDEYLGGVGYIKIADTYMNSIYVEKEFAKAKGLAR